ncbi:MAG: hypothetical protein JRH18_10420 [Deltaproteobacteria bacterium]|nr:hypothetical protein [Deltaproteobacteria bacterium]MBW1961599.1 hypothetical protein [Deltaproteobacteria bacterium]MBW1995726.1 hypothetical protein [Deltaproteobacteria bacterium]MBW2152070.1 hypothetical protein [Deltaproteobacteria bacterium]
MKLFLILLFIALFIYLVFYMTAGNSQYPEQKEKPEVERNHKSILILNELMNLNDKELYRLKDDIRNIKSLLDTGDTTHFHQVQKKGVFSKVRSMRHTERLGAEAVLKKINKDIKRIEKKNIRFWQPYFSKRKIIFVQIMLILITVLVIIL